MVATVDLTGALARGGPLAGCEEILRRWFDWDGPALADPAALLAALQGSELQERIGWHQDRVLATPEPGPGSGRARSARCTPPPSTRRWRP